MMVTVTTPRKEKVKVFLVDDHPIVRQGLVQLISQSDSLEVCGEAGDARSALREVEKSTPDVVVVDLILEDGGGFDLIKSLLKLDSSMKVLVLTMQEEPFYVERAFRSGAHGFLTKNEASEQVLVAIEKLMQGELYVAEKISPRLLKQLLSGKGRSDESPISRFSDRELQVFQLIGEGLGTKEIAERLILSVKTIETYRAHIKEKLELRDARELVQYAIRWHIRNTSS
jgi:DNA-binding NarL/FixJ family response regulator